MQKDLGDWIDSKSMQRRESEAQKEVLIVAEDSAVAKLVENEFSEVTVANICRGVKYRFLISSQAPLVSG